MLMHYQKHSNQFKEAVLNKLSQVKVIYLLVSLYSKKVSIFQPRIVGKSDLIHQVLVCQKSVRQINGQTKKSSLLF